MSLILITGVGRGIGKALAQRFLDNGDMVVGTSTRGRIDWAHKNLRVFQLDLSLAESIEACTKQLSALDWKFDVLINNSGIWSENESAEPVNIQSLRRVLEVNLIGTVDFTEHVLPLIKDGGDIVNISSRAGSMEQTSHAMYPDYKISKAALNMFTRVLAMRLQGSIRVSSVHPGWVQTDMGGSNADLTPQEAADDIFKLVQSKPESGQFWYKGKKFAW